jgi:hypothetical protein
MNELTATKDDFVNDLIESGLQVETVAFIPERITPPIVVIRPGGSYLSPSVLGAKEWQLSLEADLIAATAGNQMVEENLDALIVALIDALPTYARLVSISAPTGLTTGNAEYLSATATLELAINLTPVER